MNYPGSFLHQLSGDKKDFHAVRVSGNWRIFLKFIDGDAYTVDYDDYHNKTVERFVYAYIIDGEKLCLIDTGVAGAETDISIALQKINKKLSDIDIIILTHSHPDHIGAASSIQRQSEAHVWKWGQTLIID